MTQLLIFLHELYLSFDENVEQVVVYLDFIRAFDSVDHPYLIVKLTNFGFDENFVVLISSYLENRKQRVKIGNFSSDCLPVFSGVPQGSVLGTILLFFNLHW